jgi:hypothetical protein
MEKLIEKHPGARNWRHGWSKTRLYGVWCLMRARCEKPTNKSFPSYGGRGIKVCERWSNFQNFFADMGDRPSPKHLLDRIDNDGPYSPDNCRWVGSIREQRSNCRDNRRLTHNGETLILSEWARRIGIDPDTISERLNSLGWTVEDALTRPLTRKLITHQGETLGLSEWSARTGISRRTLSDRLKKGWPPHRVLSPR